MLTLSCSLPQLRRFFLSVSVNLFLVKVDKLTIFQDWLSGNEKIAYTNSMNRKAEQQVTKDVARSDRCG